MCALGNLFFGQNLNNVYHQLRKLNIGSDTFGNLGLKNLMLNHFPTLELITFDNTNLTSDCIKILRKKFPPDFHQIGFTNQKDFQYG